MKRAIQAIVPNARPRQGGATDSAAGPFPPAISEPKPRVKHRVKALLLSALAIGVVSPAHAVSVNTLIRLNGSSGADPDCYILDGGAGTRNCMISEVTPSNTAVYTTNADVTYRAAPGDIGIAGSLDVAVSDFGFAGGFNSNLNYSLNSFDTLTFGIDSGTFLLPIDIGGSLAAFSIPQGQTGSGVTSNVRTVFNVGSRSGGVSRNTEVYQRQDVATTGFTYRSEETGKLGTTLLSLPFANGQLELTTSISGWIYCNGRLESETQYCRGTVDYLNSARYLAASVLDGNGDAVQNPTITATSGFDYLVGLPPHAVVPLPAAGWMLLAGLAGLGAAGRRRTCQAG